MSTVLANIKQSQSEIVVLALENQPLLTKNINKFYFVYKFCQKSTLATLAKIEISHNNSPFNR